MKVRDYNEIKEVISYAFSDIYDGLIDELGAGNVDSDKVNLEIIKVITEEIGKKDITRILKKV